MPLIGNTLTAWREMRGLSKRALATRAGLSANSIVDYERGSEPGAVNAGKIARALRLARDWDRDSDDLADLLAVPRIEDIWTPDRTISPVLQAEMRRDRTGDPSGALRRVIDTLEREARGLEPHPVAAQLRRVAVHVRGLAD